MKQPPLDHENSIKRLGQIRSDCAALKVLVDDELWPRFEAWHRFYDRAACHQSVLLKPLERGYLDTVTAPIHRYLLPSWSEINPNYRSDLSEDWMLNDDEIERNRRSKMFRSRLVELQFASWLEAEDWTILGLEALGGSSDIKACSPEGRRTSFEMKFIGLEDKSFGEEIEALNYPPKVIRLDPYENLDYLTVRICDAADQLSQEKDHKVALIVVDNFYWHRFDLQIQERWANWSTQDLQLKRPTYATVNGNNPWSSDLSAIRRHLNEIWIFRWDDRFEFHRELIEPIGLTPN